MKSLKLTLERLSVISNKEIENRKDSRIRGGLTKLNNSLNKINEFIININSIDYKVTLQVISNIINLNWYTIRRLMTEEQKEIIKNHNKLIKYNKIIKGIISINSLVSMPEGQNIGIFSEVKNNNNKVPINSLVSMPEGQNKGLSSGVKNNNKIPIDCIVSMPDRQNIGIFSETGESEAIAQNLNVETMNNPSTSQLEELSEEISLEPIQDIHSEIKIDLNASNKELTHNQIHWYKKFKEIGLTDDEILDVFLDNENTYENTYLTLSDAFKFEVKERPIASIESYQVRNKYGDSVNYDEDNNEEE